MSNITKRESTRTLVLGAILTGLVFLLQMLGSFIHIGPFSISLVLVPIVIGAATCNWKISAWLGTVFGIAVLVSGDAASFLAIDVAGTVVTVLLKGMLCGLVAGLVYKLLEKKNRYLAVVASAIVCPIVNTGVFLLGCLVFFLPTVASWGAAEGYQNVAAYMFLGLAGGNFLVELLINIILSPVIVRILNIRKKA
ncbi:MAG: ECF transporter S component [Clostridia bacterium]|nr:ECF transporter S component [Clostridia bacterium]